MILDLKNSHTQKRLRIFGATDFQHPSESLTISFPETSRLILKNYDSHHDYIPPELQFNTQWELRSGVDNKCYAENPRNLVEAITLKANKENTDVWVVPSDEYPELGNMIGNIRRQIKTGGIEYMTIEDCDNLIPSEDDIKSVTATL